MAWILEVGIGRGFGDSSDTEDEEREMDHDWGLQTHRTSVPGTDRSLTIGQ